MKVIEVTIKIVALLVAFSLWIPIGFLVWIALFMRLIGVFTADILFRAMSSSKKIHNYTEQFSVATRIYPDGFSNIYKALFDSTESTHLEDDFSWGSLVKTTLWTIIFWVIASCTFNFFDSRRTLSFFYSSSAGNHSERLLDQQITDSTKSDSALYTDSLELLKKKAAVNPKKRR